MHQVFSARFVARFALAAVVISVAPVSAGQACKIAVDCPMDNSGDTIVVPRDVIALSDTMKYCANEPYFAPPRNSPFDTVSVVLVIDHSSNMSAIDSGASRYALAEAMIDSMKVRSPLSEVGIVVFSNQLMFNHEQDPFFVQLDPASGWHDSYVPLTQLNTQANVDKLKWAIELSTTGKDAGGSKALLHADYGPTGRHDGRFPGADSGGSGMPPYTGPDLHATIPGYNGMTDVSLAFDAAKKALLSARYRKEKHYVIFMSGGVARFIDYERQLPINHTLDYIQGAGMATTQTAFFIAPTAPVPQQIRQMTTNIQANGYSSTNPSSYAWRTAGANSSLLEELLGNTVGQRRIVASLVTMSINGIAPVSFDSVFAFFPGVFPLAADTTVFSGSMTLHYSAPMDSDITMKFMFTVQKGDSAALPAGVRMTCWDTSVAVKDGKPRPCAPWFVAGHAGYLTVSSQASGIFSLSAIDGRQLLRRPVCAGVTRVSIDSYPPSIAVMWFESGNRVTSRLVTLR